MTTLTLVSAKAKELSVPRLSVISRNVLQDFIRDQITTVIIFSVDTLLGAE